MPRLAYLPLELHWFERVDGGRLLLQLADLNVVVALIEWVYRALLHA